jgi:hypothetical protein
MILALRRGSRPVEAGRIDTWGPPPKEGIKFNTVIGEKMLLRIEEENPNEGKWKNLFLSKDPCCRSYCLHRF